MEVNGSRSTVCTLNTSPPSLEGLRSLKIAKARLKLGSMAIRRGGKWCQIGVRSCAKLGLNRAKLG